MTRIPSKKTAIVTGAASGIGAATALLLARQGMNVVLADIQSALLEQSLQKCLGEGLSAKAFLTDVSDPESVKALADFTEHAFGDIHLSFNNAGVAMHGVPMAQMRLPDWQWVMDVNIKSIVHSIHHILPRLRQHGQAAHFINTASIGGLQVNPNWLTGAYSMTKYAVVAMSEGLRNELADTPIHVGVLCPGAVASDFGSAQSRPTRLGGPTSRPEQAFLAQALSTAGVSPEFVARRIWHAIQNKEFFIFTDSAMRSVIEERHQSILTGFETADTFKTQLDH
jgi:NAD(P)-dependent dehydrogenase (short-subunit alcohol dehydrogenase family)